MIAAFAAGVALLAVVALILVATLRDYAGADERVDATLGELRVAYSLSPTIVATPAAPATRRVATLLERARSERATATRDLETAKSLAALLGMLAIALTCAVLWTLQRVLREREALAARVRAEQNHDALTGLPSRIFFAEWLAFAIAHARRMRAHVGVLFIDINGCPAVAELHGGPTAEALVVEIARRFRAAAREGDVFARLGPTEFALATPNAEDPRTLALLAQRLRDALDDPALPPLADTPIGTSIGIAFYPEDAADSAGIMAAANAAMYAARRAGRNHVAFHALAA
ncbi:MAG: diguanylate cyclase domain-containing protein [Rudaea sp.]